MGPPAGTAGIRKQNKKAEAVQKQFRSTMIDLITTFSSLWLLSRSLDG